MRICAIILAAGQGTRMRSTKPKVLHPLMGHPLVWYSLNAAQQATGTIPVVVVGHAAEEVRQTFTAVARFVVQEPQLGTGHAVLQARSLLEGQVDLVLVTYADMPLLSAETMGSLIQAQMSHRGAFTMLTVSADDPRGFGRVVRDPRGKIKAVVEESQATPAELEIRELNAGVYCFDAGWLWKNLDAIPISPKGEYFLTDLVSIASQQDVSIRAITVHDPLETLGINTRVHLAEAEAALKQRINQSWMEAGVSLVDPAHTYIEPDVTIGQDTVIAPNTFLQGDTRIGENCTIGPNTIILDTQIGNGCTILSSVVEGSILEDGVEVGPFGHLRKGSHLANGVHMGNFGEVKNSYLGPGVKMGHFSYLGDATIGAEANIGCGTITCNFDGEKKNPTEIGAGAFIGSDTMLVAPIKVGEGARTGAGSVVTKNVPPHTLVVGIPARAIRKLKEGT